MYGCVYTNVYTYMCITATLYRLGYLLLYVTNPKVVLIVVAVFPVIFSDLLDIARQHHDRFPSWICSPENLVPSMLCNYSTHSAPFQNDLF